MKTIKQAAAQYPCSERTIRRYIVQGKIPATQAGKRALIRIPDDWPKFLKAKK